MSGKTPLIIVTGASQGIGRAIARSLVVDHGRHVLAVARNEQALQALAAELGNDRLETLALDLELPDAPGQVVQRVAGRRVAGLVNNAGLLIRRPFGEWTAADAARLFHVNATVPFLLAQALAPQLDGDPPGHVVNISSMGGYQDSAKFPSLAFYSAAKAALACLSQCLAEEFRERGIRSNCLALGAVDTAMLRAAFPGYAAPVTPETMGAYAAVFVLEGHNVYNGRVLPVALGTP